MHEVSPLFFSIKFSGLISLKFIEFVKDLGLPVADRVRVQISQGREELFHDLGCFNLIQVFVLDDVVEQLATFTVSIRHVQIRSDYQ